jgi:hypothetical protein
MRSVPSAWTTLETSRQREVALLIHIYAKHNGRVTLPDGWGSWTYSVGFQGNVAFTDLHDYAGDGIQSRTYAPAAIEFDASQVFRQEQVGLDPHDIKLIVDPEIEPFNHYVNRRWPLTFGIVIYKVHRTAAGGVPAPLTVDDGHGTQIPVVDVAFVGYLDADDTLYTNSAGLEKTITDGRLKLETKWDHVTKAFQREVPRPVFSIDCPKTLFSTGEASIACNADMGYVQIDGQVVAVSGPIISAVEWGPQPDAWFAGGLLQYTGHDPITDLDFDFSLRILSSSRRAVGGATYGDLTLEMPPPLPIIDAIASAFGGCDRTRPTCITKFIPAGADPPPPGAFTPGSLRITLQLANTASHPGHAYITIRNGAVSIVYDKSDSGQIDDIVIGAAPWNPSWTTVGSTLTASENYSSGLPTSRGYRVTLINNGFGTPEITQQPVQANGYALIIKTRGGAGSYDFTASWSANAGQPVNTGNLQNFGGTDIPVEHPSMETTA